VLNLLNHTAGLDSSAPSGTAGRRTAIGGLLIVPKRDFPSSCSATRNNRWRRPTPARMASRPTNALCPGEYKESIPSR